MDISLNIIEGILVMVVILGFTLILLGSSDISFSTPLLITGFIIIFGIMIFGIIFNVYSSENETKQESIEMNEQVTCVCDCGCDEVSPPPPSLLI